MSPHTTICVLILLCIVLILLYLCVQVLDEPMNHLTFPQWVPQKFARTLRPSDLLNYSV
jgi:hypothetical protein